MKKLNCLSCGGTVSRKGPGEYVCDFCGTAHHIDEGDVRLDRAFQLDDKSIRDDIKVVEFYLGHYEELLKDVRGRIEKEFVAAVVFWCLSLVPLLIILKTAVGHSPPSQKII